MSSAVEEEKGTISIHTENIFPIIKKFLYSDHEIFLRELVSNAVDALQKLKRISAIGEYDGEIGEAKVEVKVDAEAKTITISDNGIGMTAEEIKKYINQIAFSGASEFLEKYKGEDKGQIIGQFGLGFYSAFMVAREVEIDTLSWRPDATPARWICDGSTEFSISAGSRTERGTTITLHIAEDSEDFLDSYKLREIVSKYFKFIPTPIELDGERVNTGEPLWSKSPADLTDEDYKKFYRDLYPMSGDPLFWIHLNVDFPFNLTGILYFPKVDPKMEVQKDKIKLYSRQVFITDEVKDVVPEFLMLLHGIIDSPDIPLNVSRSFLQADGNVKKINSHITKKVADKLAELYRDDRDAYEQKWQDIGVFVKYGMLTEPKFNDRAKDFCLVRNTEGKFFNIEEYREKVRYNQTDKDDNLVWLYTSDADAQAVYIDAVKKRDYDVLVLDHVLDNHFAQHLERVAEKITVKRIDGDSPDKLIDKGTPELDLLTSEQKELAIATFKAALVNDKLDVKIENLTADDLPVTLTQSEQMRRMRDMYKAQGMADFFGSMDLTSVIVNANHPLVNQLVATEDEANRNVLAAQLYDLALLSQGKLTGKGLSEFVNRSLNFLGK
jgi:molecular chaperone HtpG